MRRNSDANMPKNLPSNEKIADTIRDLRTKAGITQAEMADKVGKTRSWMMQIERNKINPIYFYKYFVEMYGRKLSIKTYGIDWDLYRSDRVALYYVYYDVNRAVSCEKLGCSYTALRHLLEAEDKYIDSYQRGIDKLFPKMKKDQKLLSHLHLVGADSLAEINGDRAYITLNCAKNRTLDSLENRDKLNADVDYWIEWHKAHDGKPETGSIILPD